MLPTSNIDIVPTILHLHNLAVPPEMDGRIMYELLTDSSAEPGTVKKDITEVTAKHKWGTYRIVLQRSVFGEHKYVDFAQVQRQTSGK